MHRNERIARAISTLQAIEDAVRTQTNVAIGLSPNGTSDDPNAPHVDPQFLQARIDNAVRIYCAADVAEAVSYTARE